MSGPIPQPSLYGLPDALEALKRRDRSAQEKVFRTEQPRLMAIARATLRDHGAAEHLVADVFTDFFYDNVQALRASHAIPAYLRIMTIRRAQRLNLRRSNQDDVTEFEIPGDEGAELMERVDTRLWLRWLEACIATLTHKARAMLKLHYGHDLSLTDIASHGGVSKQAVSKSIQKCLGFLKKCLETRRRESATAA